MDTQHHTKGLKYRIAVPLVVISFLFLSSCGSDETPAATETIEASPATSSPTTEPATPESTNTPLPSSTPVPSPTFDITSVEDWGSGRLLFSIEEHSFGEINYQGIYELDLDTGALDLKSSPGTRILDISPDHMQILVAQESILSLIDLSTGSMTQLADDYFYLSPSGAKWDHSQNLIYYIAGDSTDLSLIKIETNNGEIQQLDTPSPIAVLDVVRGTIILGKGTCNPFGNCVYSDLIWINDQGNEIASRDLENIILLPCQRSNQFIYSVKDENNTLSLHIRPHDGGPETVFWALNTEYADCTWSPGGNSLAVIVIDRYWYNGEIQAYYFQVLLPGTNQILDRSYLKAPLDHLAWSPDGEYMTFSGTEQTDEAFQIVINLVKLDNFAVNRFDQYSEFKSENYLTIPEVFWAP